MFLVVRSFSAVPVSEAVADASYVPNLLPLQHQQPQQSHSQRQRL